MAVFKSLTVRAGTKLLLMLQRPPESQINIQLRNRKKFQFPIKGPKITPVKTKTKRRSLNMHYNFGHSSEGPFSTQPN